MAGPATYFDPSRAGSLDAATRDLVERRDSALGAAYRLFYEEPVQFVRGLGTKLWDADGNEYLDAYNNVPSVGHSHPRVAAAIASQAATLNTHTRYLQAGIIDYAEQVLATLPDSVNTMMFTCTGSEANDLALRLAKHVTGNTGVIVTSNAYHGVTAEIAAISPSLGGPSSLAPWVRMVDPLDLAAGVSRAIAELAASGIQPAAFIVDTILASDGVLPDISGLVDAATAVRAAGGLFIADEVQPGFGRLGSDFWGFARHSVVPDIVTVGKPMGNGHPIAAVMARRDIVDAFGREVRYFNTFGGNTVSIAAAQATLDVLLEEELQQKALVIGNRIVEGFRSLGTERIVDVRGQGLFIGVHLRGGADAAIALTNDLRQRRVLVSTAGPLNDTIKIRPPLPFSASDSDRLLEEFSAALALLG